MKCRDCGFDMNSLRFDEVHQCSKGLTSYSHIIRTKTKDNTYDFFDQMEELRKVYQRWGCI
jgi:predicted Zn-ribbon and HTH transcriptional regulator